MELAELSRLIERSTHSAFRLETLPQYLVPQEADEFAEWRAGRRRPLDTPATSPWLARIKSSTDQGYRWYRARILDYPLSEYSEFELYGYQANKAAGEEICVANREWHANLAALREDFWLIDDEIAVRMLYDGDGHFIRPERATDVTPYLEVRSRALANAVELTEYLERWEPGLTA